MRLGPKRPPLAAGVRRDGTGVVRVARTPGIVDAIARVAPRLDVEEVEIAGPPTSSALRAAGWAEAAVLLAAAQCEQGDRDAEVSVDAPNGAHATALVATGRVSVSVACGEALDEVVLRSYCIGAAHMALGWVTSEALAVDGDGDGARSDDPFVRRPARGRHAPDRCDDRAVDRAVRERLRRGVHSSGRGDLDRTGVPRDRGRPASPYADP